MAAPATKKSVELLEAQNRVLELIAREIPLPEVLDSLLRVIQLQYPGMLCSILLLDDDGVHVRHGAARDLPEMFVRAVDGEPIGPRAGSCGTAAYRRERVITEDIATDPLWEDYRGLALSYGLRACWSTPILGAEGKVVGTFAMYFAEPCRPDAQHLHLIDVSTHIAAIAITRHQRLQALRVSEERLRLALTGGNVDIWEYDVATARLAWRGQLNTVFGWPANLESLTLDAFADTIHPRDRESVQLALQDPPAWDSGRDFEFRVYYPDGSLHWFALKGRSERDAKGKASRIRGVAVEITERKRAQEEIQSREAQLIEAQKIARLGSYEWDVRTQTVRRSHEFCRIFGLVPDEQERTPESPLSPAACEESAESQINTAFEHGQPFDFEERIVRPDGTVRTLHIQGQWRLDDDQRPVKLVGTCQDITERKQVEQQLRTANAALARELKERTRAEREIQGLTARLINAQEEERTRLARELHDDLCQQIASLGIAASNLKKDISPEALEARTQSEQIQQRLFQLSESIRQLSHNLHPAVLEYSGLGAALQSYCSEFGALTGIRVAFRSEGSFDHLPTQVALCLYRIAQEALQNVRKHAQVEHAQLTVTRLRDFVSLVVADQGIGLDTRRATTSLGLGLVSIKERTRLVNGTLHVESKPNQGTTLIVTVPVPAVQAAAFESAGMA